MDYKELERVANGYALTYLHQWVSGGTLVGKEYEAATISGGHGRSFKYNIENHKWSEFNSAEEKKGRGLISLYKEIFSKTISEANRDIMNLIGYNPKEQINSLRYNLPKIYNSKKGGAPKNIWKWMNENDELVALTVRFEYADENGIKRKDISQWHFSESMNKWVPKKYPQQMPIYNLSKILKYPEKKVLIVEGEKCVDAAEKLFKDSIIVTTWAGGVPAATKSNWSVLINRKITIWPDNDKDGIEAAKKINSVLASIASEIKIINVNLDTTKPKKWDVADAVSEGMSISDFNLWVVNYLEKIKPLPLAVVNKDVITSPEVKNIEVLQAEPISYQTNIDSESILNPISHMKMSVVWSELGLQTTGSGTPHMNDYNVYLTFKRAKDFGIHFKYDEFKMKKYISYDKKKWSTINDFDIGNLQLIMQGKYGVFRASKNHIETAISRVCYENKYNSVYDYITTEKWDGIKRIDRFFIDYFNCHDTNYSEAVSKNFWIGLVRRALTPSVKFDNMVIIEGAQGIRKSSALELIGGPFYDVMWEEPNTKDFYMKFHGNIIMEIAELDSFRKSESTTLKRLLSTNVDSYRKPYDVDPMPHPRTCLLMGTTNRTDYLSDSTGNRRYWPIEAKKINIELLKDTLFQLYAEAFERHKTEESHWEIPDQYMEEIYNNRINEARDDSASGDPWYDYASRFSERSIGNSFDLNQFMVSHPDLNGLGLEVSRISRKERIRVVNIIKDLGYKVKIKKTKDRRSYRVYEKDL